MKLFDTHAHILDERFNEDRENILATLGEKGIGNMVECSSDIANSVRAAALASAHHAIFAAVGVHPHSAQEWDEPSKGVLRALCREKKVVAIGEIGLDYHYDFSPRDVQKRVFEEQIRLAEELDLPIVVHSREATLDTMNILRKHSKIRGELHCFSGSAETAEELVGMGFYIAFGGSLTFKNARKTIEAAQVVPVERLLLETDCPYMTPVPLRGQRNEPAYVRYVAEKMAEVREMDVLDVARITTENAKRFFEIDEM